jgi:hypothetical protein
MHKKCTKTLLDKSHRKVLYYFKIIESSSLKIVELLEHTTFTRGSRSRLQNITQILLKKVLV